MLVDQWCSATFLYCKSYNSTAPSSPPYNYVPVVPFISLSLFNNSGATFDLHLLATGIYTRLLMHFMQ